MAKKLLQKKEQRWSHAEVDYLHEHYKTICPKQMAACLKRPEDEVRQMLMTYELKAARNPLIRWTPEEDKFLRENVETKSNNEIALHLNKNVDQVLKRLCKLKIKRSQEACQRLKVSTWKPEEDQFIKDNLAIKTNPEIAISLGTTELAVKHRIQKLGLKRSRQQLTSLDQTTWTPEEDQFLRDNYATMPWRDIALSLNRDIKAVKTRRFKLGLKRTPEQIKAVFRINHDALDLSLNYTKWSDEDIAYLKENWSKQTARQLNPRLKRSMLTIRVKAQELKLQGGIAKAAAFNSQKPKPEGKGKKQYTLQEDQFILENYSKLSNTDMAKVLGKTQSSVTYRIWALKNLPTPDKKNAGRKRNVSKEQILGMIEKSGHVLWTPEEDQFLRDNWATKTSRELAILLNRSRSSVRWRFKELEIKPKSTEDVEKIKLSFSSLPDSLVANFLFRDANQRQQALSDPNAMKLVAVKKGHVLLRRIIKKQSQ